MNKHKVYYYNIVQKVRELFNLISEGSSEIESAKFQGNDIVFEKEDGSQVILSNAKQELKGENGFPTESQWNALLARVEALEE